MYPIERYLYKLKKYVNNKAFPEGSMAEGYIAKNCLNFCSMYLNDIETKFNKVERNYEKLSGSSQHSLSVFSENSRLIGKAVYDFLDEKSLKQITTSTDTTRLVSEDLLHLAYDPDRWNFGVVVKVEEEYRLRDYYGILTELIQLEYLGNHQIVLFKCDWFEGKSIQKNKYNCTSINTSKPWKTNESYVLASQEQQVFYINDIKLDSNWKVVIKAQAWSSWNILENKGEEPYKQNASHSAVHIDYTSEFVEWHRNGIPTITINLDEVKLVEDHVETFIDDQDEEKDSTLAEYDDEKVEEYNIDDNEDGYDFD
ncbi:UNVERIFIED_CONTAM: hypothetical protein Sradi_3641100 [Sesamum radiatum]|uniref:DUF4218 domain-containing protein n=1 Tax=Sesamum radiatum TaxID=300843 RepID=A0AAW2QJ09_SESRA